MTALPGSPSLRRRAAFVFLAVGTVLAASSIARDWPREQTLIFRLEDELAQAPVRLDASVTRAGDSEAQSGFTLIRDGDEAPTARHKLRVPDGEYVVTVTWALTRSDASAALGLKESETTSVRRVTLSGGEVVVPIGPRVSD